MLERAVGSLDDASIFWRSRPAGESQGQVASLGLLLHARNQAAAQGVELDFAHDALHPEQQTAIGGRSIVDAIAVRNQTDYTHTDRARETNRCSCGIGGGFIAQHDADPAPAPRRPAASYSRHAAGKLVLSAEVRLDHLDALIGPAELTRMLTHGVLELLTLGKLVST